MKYFNMLDIKLSQIQIFLAAAQRESITKAAQYLHLSQSMVSKNIKYLEDTLGLYLFIRDKQHLRLTPAGRHLMEEFSDILALSQKALEKAQQKVEERNFDIRKNLLKYDNVMNDQRKVIYEQRKELMKTEDVSETVRDMRDEFIGEIIRNYAPYGTMPSEWDLEGLKQELSRTTGFVLPLSEMAADKELTADAFQERVIGVIEEAIAEKNKGVPDNVVKFVEKSILLQVLDQLWKDHIAALDMMRHTIVLRAYGQKDPLNEYKKEAFNMFSYLLDQLREKVTFLICRTQIQTNAVENMARAQQPRNVREIHETPQSVVGNSAPAADEAEKQTPFQHKAFDPKDPSTWGRVARNDLCPCGSGKKFKHCHGRFM